MKNIQIDFIFIGQPPCDHWILGRVNHNPAITDITDLLIQIAILLQVSGNDFNYTLSPVFAETQKKVSLVAISVNIFNKLVFFQSVFFDTKRVENLAPKFTLIKRSATSTGSVFICTPVNDVLEFSYRITFRMCSQRIANTD
jgi:hypothetical protein